VTCESGMAYLTLAVFAAILLIFVLLDLPLIPALLIGLGLFLCYGKFKRLSWKKLGELMLGGIWTAGPIMITMLLIGILTACWRASGTVSAIICYSARLIRPSVFLPVCFLLNCLVSVLTGTSFGTAATMGVICMTMANTLGVSAFWTGGAILAGSFFGDRCSPVSTSALLVCTLTDTEITENIRRMVKTALLPFLLSCLVYLLAGMRGSHGSELLDVKALFSKEFVLSWVCVLPAIAVLVVSAFRVRVRITLAVSISLAVVLALTVQGSGASELLKAAVFGYEGADADVARMINGGGLVSMLNVSGIILISSCYAGLFQGTGILDGVKHGIDRLADKITPFGAMVLMSVAGTAISCNQTLAIMLTHQLCGDLAEEKEQLALDLEDSAVVIAPLIPWSIASAVPLATVNAPTASILAACYLYLLPISRLAGSLVRKYGKNPTRA